jgi:nicotinate-nucleotide adenylyltransferase
MTGTRERPHQTARGRAGGTGGQPAPPLLVLYGGTFDPVHEGHLAVARCARDALAATVHFMPAADPPHRPAPGASAAQRVEMLELALAGEPGLALDTRELARAEPSWTVETLRGLRRELGPEAPVALLLGADSFLGLPQWREWRQLFGLAHFVVAERAGSPLDAGLPEPLAAAVEGRLVDDPARLREAPAGRVFRLRQPLQPGSASGLRARVAGGGDWQALVPPAVAGYIRRHRLYVGRGVTKPPL